MSDLDKILKKVLLIMDYDSKKTLSENKKETFVKNLKKINIQEEVTNDYDINNKKIAFKGNVVSKIKNALLFRYPPKTKGEILLLNLSGFNSLNFDQTQKEQYYWAGNKNYIYDVSYNGGKKSWEDFVKTTSLSTQKDIFSWVNADAPYQIYSEGNNYYLNLNCLESSDGHSLSSWNTKQVACNYKEQLRGGGYFDDRGKQLHIVKFHVKNKESNLSQDFKEIVITSDKTNTLNNKKSTEIKKSNTLNNKKSTEIKKTTGNDIVIDDI